MKNILLIDDEANKGWQEVIQKVLFKDDPIQVALDMNSAKVNLSNTKYDLIFLDLRFGEGDHCQSNISNFGGYKLLINEIRNSFQNQNFSTPVMLFTASNKAWNIFEMIENGADDFYIKEHPDTAYDLEFSRKNYIRLKENVPKLIELGEKRNDIWLKINYIIEQSKTTIQNQNIWYRIEEKLKIGYGLLFRKMNKVERINLLYNNEIVAFIIFWSILEEISHDYYNRKNETDISWTLQKINKIIQYEDTNGCIYSLFSTIKEEFNNFSVNQSRNYAHQINLSNQISAILRYQLNWNHHKIHDQFLSKLNTYRNDIDFIHSSTESILFDRLKLNQDSPEGYKKCLHMLDFISQLLT